MILRHGLRYPKDTRWTQAHHDWLARAVLEPAASQQALAAELETETLLMAHVKRLDAMIADLVAGAGTDHRCADVFPRELDHHRVRTGR